MPESNNIFSTLEAIDITEQLKEKNKLSYLPWSSAWSVVKRNFPDATYTIIKSEDNLIYHTDGKTCWVETSVTIGDETQNECLAVMNYRNQAISVDDVTSVDANKSIKRCLTKNVALFGLGLSLWNGEELSDAAKQTRAVKTAKEKAEAEEAKKIATELSAENAKIIELAKKKIAQGIDSDSVYQVIMNHTNGKKNPNAIKDIETSKQVYKEINAMKKNVEVKNIVE